MKRLIALMTALACCSATPKPAVRGLPSGFVYLSDAAPTVAQDIRYAGGHNLVGRALPGYLAPVCILAKSAAIALAKAQSELLSVGLTLRVYDCYRPKRAIDALAAWSRNAADQRMKGEYYPRVDKSKLFALGYLSRDSSHARGSGVDLTVERLPVASPLPWVPGRHSCIAPFAARYHEGSIDMGTSYDCMDPLSRTDTPIGVVAETHRTMLRELMGQYGFKPVNGLWWSFALAREPFPKTVFDFPITEK